MVLAKDDTLEVALAVLLADELAKEETLLVKLAVIFDAAVMLEVALAYTATVILSFLVPLVNEDRLAVLLDHESIYFMFLNWMACTE